MTKQRSLLRLVAAAVVALNHAPAHETRAQTEAAPPDQRLESFASELERLRVENHIPGMAIAIVKDDALVFTRGFGMADVEHEIPVTPETRFAIGSTTKAFTATLVGMLVDDGRVHWDDPVERYLPYFKLAVQTGDTGDKETGKEEGDQEQATLRDLLSHRTGFPRMSLLWANGALSSDEILHQAVHAEPFAPLRERWYYNNVMYLAAGTAAATAAGSDWSSLIRARILEPLHMDATKTSLHACYGKRDTARAYSWDEDADKLLPAESAAQSERVDSVAPAGALCSTALDMAKWLRFLLADGVADDKPLISEESLKQTWTPQIVLGGGAGYGMGWIRRDWRGQPLLLHDGALPGGYSTLVALLPESHLGFVVVTNLFPTVFPSLVLAQVTEALLGSPGAQPTSGEGEDFAPYLGRYVANFATFSNEVFTVREQNGRLALDIPSQMVFELKPPDEEGKRYFALTDQIAVSFETGKNGSVSALEIYQAGMEFEAQREGVKIEPEIDLDELQKYLGTYATEAGEPRLRLEVANQRLAMRMIDRGLLFDLHAPDTTGRWTARANPNLGIAFEQAPDGTIAAVTVWQPGRSSTVRLVRVDAEDSKLPTADEIVALREKTGALTSSGPKSLKTSGTIRFPQSAVEGRFTVTVAGHDRQRADVDLGRYGQIRSAIDGDRAWTDSGNLMEPFRELHGDRLEQARLSHPAVLSGDWRQYFDSVRVLRAGEVDGRKTYVIKLESGDLPPTKLDVDAETGDLLRIEQSVVTPVGGLPVTTLLEDYREVHGLRLPYRRIESNEQTGKTVYVIDKVEADIPLPDDFFVLRPQGDR